MPDNIIRFRADEDLLSALRARAHGASLGETARRDLAEYYARLAWEQWPEMWKRMLQAFVELHNVAFDATEATGCRAQIAMTDHDGTRREVPIYGHNGLLASLKLMAERGLLDQSDFVVYQRLEATREQIVLERERVVPLGEVRTFLYEVERMKQRLLQFVPEHQR